MKKKVTKGQLVEDGIAQIKTLRQLKAQGIIIKNTTYALHNERFEFNPEKVKHTVPLNNKMLEDCGKVLKVVRGKTDKDQIEIEDVHNYGPIGQIGWVWPLEAIER